MFGMLVMSFVLFECLCFGFVLLACYFWVSSDFDFWVGVEGCLV